MMDAIDRPACSTPFPTARRQKPDAEQDRGPQNGRMARAGQPIRVVFGRAAAKRRAFQKSITVVEASAFRAALRLDMPAARMAAIARPEMPGGKMFQTNYG